MPFPTPNDELLCAKLKTLDQCSFTYEGLCGVIRLRIAASGALDALKQLVLHGPVEDGDILSKSQRDGLIQTGLATRVYFKGQQGYTAATYVGGDVLNSTGK